MNTKISIFFLIPTTKITLTDGKMIGRNSGFPVLFLREHPQLCKRSSMAINSYNSIVKNVLSTP